MPMVATAVIRTQPSSDLSHLSGDRERPTFSAAGANVMSRQGGPSSPGGGGGRRRGSVLSRIGAGAGGSPIGGDGGGGGGSSPETIGAFWDDLKETSPDIRIEPAPSARRATTGSSGFASAAGSTAAAATSDTRRNTTELTEPPPSGFLPTSQSSVMAAAVAEHQRRRSRARLFFTPILPTSTRKLEWDFLVGVVTLISVVVVPFKVGFNLPATPTWISFDLLVDSIFLVDMLVSFNAGYFADAAEETVVLDRRKITTRYLKGWFFVDLVSTLPFDYIVTAARGEPLVDGGRDSVAGIELRLTKLVRGLRLFRLAKIVTVAVKVRRLHKAASSRWDINPAISPLVKMICFIMYGLHVLGCGWYFVCTIRPESMRTNWIGELRTQIEGSQSLVARAASGVGQENEMTNLSSWYLYSLYWAASTMFAVGYGDIHPYNTVERIYAIFTQVVGAMVFGYIIGTISFLAEVANPRASALHKRMDELKDWMTARQLPIGLRHHIRSHMKYVWNFRSLYDEVNILDNLSGDLRRRLVFQSYEDVITSVRLLRWRGVDGRMIEMIVTSIQPQIAKIGDYIVRAGSMVHGLYVLRKGHLHGLACRHAKDRAEMHHYTGIKDTKQIRKNRARKRNSLSMRSDQRRHDLVFTVSDGYAVLEADVLPENKTHQHNMHVVASTICDLLMIPIGTLLRIKSLYPKFFKKFGAVARHRQKLINSIDTSSDPVVRPLVINGELVEPGDPLHKFHCRQLHDLEMCYDGDDVLDSDADETEQEREGNSRLHPDLPPEFLRTTLQTSMYASSLSSSSEVQGYSTEKVAESDEQDREEGVVEGDGARPTRFRGQNRGRSVSLDIELGGSGGGNTRKLHRSTSLHSTHSDSTTINRNSTIISRDRSSTIMSRFSFKSSAAASNKSQVAKKRRTAIQRNSRRNSFRIVARRDSITKLQKKATQEHTNDLLERHRDNRRREKIERLRREKLEKLALANASVAGTADEATEGSSAVGAIGTASSSLAASSSSSPSSEANGKRGSGISLDTDGTEHLEDIGPSLAYVPTSSPTSQASPGAKNHPRASFYSPTPQVHTWGDPEKMKDLLAAPDESTGMNNHKEEPKQKSGESEGGASESDLEAVAHSPASLLHLRIIHPGLPSKMIWDVCVAVLIVYSVVLIPFRICFSTESTGFSLVLDYVIDVIFAIDMVLCFRTAYFLDDGRALVIVPKLIATHYMRSWFIVDFLSTMPFDRIAAPFLAEASQAEDVLGSFRLIKSFRLFRLVKMVRILKLSRITESIKDVLNFSPATFRLISLTLQVLLSAHFFGCFFYLVSTTTSDPDAMWWHPQWSKGADILANQGVVDRYIASIYWAVSTMTTVGYGDLTPRSEPEVIFCTFVLVIGATMFGYVVGNISNMVGNFNIGEKLSTDFLQEIRNYLREQRIMRGLSKEVLSYYENWLEFRTAFNEKQILNTMPHHLRIDTMMFIHRNTIPRISIFRGQSPDFITTILRLLHPQHHSAGSNIYSEGENSFEMFFVVQGTLKVGHYLGHPRSEVVTRVLHVGDSFGHVSLIRGIPRRNSVMAATRCHVLSLSRSSVDFIVNRYPPWAKVLTQAMKTLYKGELSSQHWSKLRRSVRSLSVLGRLGPVKKKKKKKKKEEEEEEGGARVGKEGEGQEEEEEEEEGVREGQTSSKYAVMAEGSVG